MERNMQLKQVSAREAAQLLADIARQLEAGVVSVDGLHVRMTPPVDVAVELDASPVVARVAINLRCRHPEGASRLLQEELARSGG